MQELASLEKRYRSLTVFKIGDILVVILTDLNMNASFRFIICEILSSRKVTRDQ